MIYINENKLNNINLDSNNFYVVMDFDKTMTTINSDDSWTVIQNPNILDPKLNTESLKLAEKYCPIEMDYNLDFNLKSEYMYDWYMSVMKLYYKYDLTYDKLLECIKCGNLILRKGLKELLQNFNKNKIPVIILSAGIGNVIKECLILNDCFYGNIHIISNFFSFDDNKLLPFNNPIIHTCNKKMSNLPNNFEKEISNKEYILLFGDFIEDINMVSKDDLYRTLSFGFLEKNVEANLESYRNSFDVVLTDNASFDDVMNVLKNSSKK